MLHRRLTLHHQVALRPEPFGALAYHYGNRKLVFLRHPDIVNVVGRLDGEATLAEVLDDCGVDQARWPSFERALTQLMASDMLTESDHALAR